MRAQTTRLRGKGSPAVVGWPNREWQLTADFVEKVEKSRVTKLAKLQSDGTSPLNIISDRPRTSHAAQSTNWLVLIFECRARRPPRKPSIAEREFFNIG